MTSHLLSPPDLQACGATMGADGVSRRDVLAGAVTAAVTILPLAAGAEIEYAVHLHPTPSTLTPYTQPFALRPTLLPLNTHPTLHTDASRTSGGTTNKDVAN